MAKKSKRKKPSLAKRTFRGIVRFIGGSLRLLIACAIFFGLLTWASYHLIGFYIRGNEIPAPDLTKMEVAAAMEEIQDYNLSLKLDSYEFNEDVPWGSIISQEPRPGTAIKERTPIKVIVSYGRELEEVPGVIINKDVREAGIRLREAGLHVAGVTHVRYPEREDNIVLTSDPPPGSGVPPDTGIHLLIASSNPYSRASVPNLIGLTEEDAIQSARESGLIVGRVTIVEYEDLPPGTIGQQDPQPGTTVTGNSVIDIWKSPVPPPTVNLDDLPIEEDEPSGNEATTPEAEPASDDVPDDEPSQQEGTNPAPTPEERPVGRFNTL